MAEIFKNCCARNVGGSFRRSSKGLRGTFPTLESELSIPLPKEAAVEIMSKLPISLEGFLASVRQASFPKPYLVSRPKNEQERRSCGVRWLDSALEQPAA
ncbi:MAG: hypothetical protein DMG06_15095 [Acidobacteria bacterium]|nr:MAG: hypothetical protein DMG06_15095 [Acidobacteriota bacterium]